MTALGGGVNNVADHLVGRLGESYSVRMKITSFFVLSRADSIPLEELRKH